MVSSCLRPGLWKSGPFYLELREMAACPPLNLRWLVWNYDVSTTTPVHRAPTLKAARRWIKEHS